MIKRKFTIDGYEDMDLIVDGYTLNESWNGWECPYFTFEQAVKIMEHFEGYYKKGTDTFVFFENDKFTETEEYTSSEHNINDELVRLYPIGSGCWVWEEYTEE